MTATLLTNASSFTIAQKFSREVLDSPWRINLDYLRARGWTAILLPGSLHDSLTERSSVVPAIERIESNGFLVISAEGVGHPEDIHDEWMRIVGPDTRNVNWANLNWILEKYAGQIEYCYSLSAANPDLTDFSREKSGLYYLYLPRSETFLIHDVSDFHVFAGPQKFLEEAIGQALDAARQQVKTPGEYWDPVDESSSLYVAELYESLDEHL